MGLVVWKLHAFALVVEVTKACGEVGGQTNGEDRGRGEEKGKLRRLTVGGRGYSSGFAGKCRAERKGQYQWTGNVIQIFWQRTRQESNGEVGGEG